VDQFVLACVLSRVQAALDARGEAKSSRELALLKVVARRVRGRVRGNFRRMDVNDDEIVKELADDAFEREAYGWDAI